MTYVENKEIAHVDIIILPVFGMKRFNEFLTDNKVWGKLDKVFLKNTTLHIRDQGRIFTVATNPSHHQMNELINVDFTTFSDNASIYIASGNILSEDANATTKYVRCTNPNSKTWSSKLADVLQAWEVEFYQDLKLAS